MTDLRTFTGGFTAMAVAAGLYALATQSEVKPVAGLAESYRFEAVPIAAPTALTERDIRPVHPDLEHIAAWISSVGASVALGDLDRDGIANDICLVDPRGDTVSLQALPVAGRTSFPPVILYRPDASTTAQGVAPMGCLIADFDNDGYSDILVYFWGRQPVIHLGNVTPLQFADVAPFGTDEIWNTNTAVLSDFDGDGSLDILFGNYFPTGSGVLDTTGKRPVEMQHSMSRARNGGHNRLYLNHPVSGRLQFRERPDALPEDTIGGWTLAVGTADLTGDGAPEVYVANDFGNDHLLINRGDGTFDLVKGQRGLMDIRSGVVGRDSFKGMGVEFGDLNGDARFDILVSNIAENYALHESHLAFVSDDSGWENGHVPLRNAAGALGLARSGWAWDVKTGDFNGDGSLEVVQATGFVDGTVNRWPELHELAMGNDELLAFEGMWPNFRQGDGLSFENHTHFFAAGPDGVFRDVAEQVGLAGTTISRGIALGDVDADGDLDMVIARQWGESVLYLNTAPQRGASLSLDLALTNENGSLRPAIGATVVATLPDGRRLLRQLEISNGHSGGNAPHIHIGLGDIPDAPVAVAVVWRMNGSRQVRDYLLAPGRHRLILDRIDSARLIP